MNNLYILSWHHNDYGTGTTAPVEKEYAMKLIGLLGLKQYTLEHYFTDDPDTEPTGEVYDGMDSDIESWGV